MIHTAHFVGGALIDGHSHLHQESTEQLEKSEDHAFAPSGVSHPHERPHDILTFGYGQHRGEQPQ